MTVIASNQTLTPKDYPDFDQTVGNAFASSYRDTVNEEDANIRKIQGVAQGLYKIYETVVDDAAKGAPMTPQDSAVIANTVANMTSSIGVESAVQRVPSLESRFEQHIGLLVTQESLSETIKRTIKALLDAIVKLGRRIVEAFGKMWDRAESNARIFKRMLNTVSRWHNLTEVPQFVKYKPAMAGILVDNQVPSNLSAVVLKTLQVCNDHSNIDTMLSVVAEMVKAIEGGKVAKMTSEQVTAEINKLVKPLKLPSGVSKDGSVSDAERTVEYSDPLCGNSVALVMNPKTNEDPISFVNYGAAVVPIEMATEFGIKEKYRLEPADDVMVTLSFNDAMYQMNNTVMAVQNQARVLSVANKRIDDIQAKLSKLATDYRVFERGTDTNDEAGETLVQFMGVARSILSAALAAAKYNFEVSDRVANSYIAVLNAFNS
jgi:hypothetical protein